MNKKIIITTGIILALASASIPVGYVQATGKNWSDLIYPGVYIENMDVSGKKLEEVESLIQKAYQQPVLSKKIEITANGKTYSLDYSKLEAKYNISEIAKEAFSYGKSKNVIERYKLIKSPEKKEYKLAFSYNTKPIEEVIDQIDKDTSKGSVNASIAITNGNIKITPEVNGTKLDKDKLKQELVKQVNGELSTEAIKIEAPLEIVKPEITAEKLSAINSQVSSFSTNFSTSIANRINNIDLATKAINGTILMPGETFSFNETVGERTKARGFKEAGVIVGDQIESGIGGGICQVSSTLYNAILKTSIKSEERRNHSLPLSYIGKGLDATVDWGHIDYKFKNTLDVPIYIEGYTKNKNVYFNVYSNESIKKKTYAMATEITDTIQPTTKYIDDPNRNEGETEVVKKAAAGYKVKTYRKTYENGKLVNTELISSDYYRPVNGEIIRGTKKPA